MAEQKTTYRRVGPGHEFKDWDRVIDLMFPEFGPATLEQHPDPGRASNYRNDRDKWITRFDDRLRPSFWISKKGAWSQLGLIDDQQTDR